MRSASMRYRKLRLSLFLCLFLFSLLLIVMNMKVRSLDPVNWVSGAMYTALDKAHEEGVKRVAHAIEAVRAHFVSKEEFKKEIEARRRLENRIQALERKLYIYKEAYRENEQLKDLLKIKNTLPYQVVGIYPLGGSSSLWTHSLVVKMGTESAVGLMKGSAVINSEGVVGIITEAHRDWGKVTLLTDPSFSIHVVDARSAVIGMLKGAGETLCALNYIMEDRDVKVGDLLLASGMAGLYPKGYPVGAITKIKPDPNSPFLKIWVKPAVDLSRLGYLLVVLPQNRG